MTTADEDGARADALFRIHEMKQEMEVVADGLDLLIRSGCDQAKNLGKYRDHLRRKAVEFGGTP
jgi:hypothetical protein